MPTIIDLGDTLQAGSGILRLPRMTSDEFWEFCQRNRDLRIERNAEGDLILMAPVGGETGHYNLRIGRYLDVWAEQDGTGIAFDSSTGFILPNGAERSPDASWVRLSRWNTLTEEERTKFPPLCPDFVVELLSPSDSRPVAHEKMEEWIANGAQMGWLIDRKRRTVTIYRPNRTPEVLDAPTEVSGDPALPGFVLPTSRIL